MGQLQPIVQPCIECLSCLPCCKDCVKKDDTTQPLEEHKSARSIPESKPKQKPKPKEVEMKQASKGTSCYSCTAKINQRPETGRKDYRIQINAQHHGNHSCDEQTLTVVFNHEAHFVSCSNGKLSGPNNEKELVVRLRYHNNPNDNIGMGDFTVTSKHNDLQIVDAYMADKEGR